MFQIEQHMQGRENLKMFNRNRNSNSLCDKFKFDALQNHIEISLEEESIRHCLQQLALTYGTYKKHLVLCFDR